MTQEELNKVFAKKNLVEVLCYTSIGLKLLYDEYSTLPFDPNYDPEAMKMALQMAIAQTEKRLIEITKED